MVEEAPVGEQDRREALLAALVELEHHVAEGGWDAPPRLFALVETDELAAAEPDLARALGLRTTADGASPGALTAIEQDTFTPTQDVLNDLAGIEWPADVFGAAVATVRTFLPSTVEVELPEDPAEAAALVAAHPAAEEIRVVVGVDRSGAQHGVARLRTQPDELLAGTDLVPGLATALAHTLG
ncbi:MAG: PPA1309 family protein [Janthinobacterium lividum]